MRTLHRTAGASITAGPLLLLIAVHAGAIPPRDAWPSWDAGWPLGATLIAALLVVLSGVWLLRVRPAGSTLGCRGVFAAGAAAFCAVMLRPSVASPEAALALLSAVALGLYLYPAAGAKAGAEEPAAIIAMEGAVSRVRAGAAVALLAGLALALRGRPDPLAIVAVASSVAAAWILALLALARRALRLPRSRLLALGVAAAGSAVGAAVTWGRWASVVGACSLLPLALVVLLRRPGVPSRIVAALVDGVLSHPARLLVVTFALLSLTGALLLDLPLATPAPIAALDAAFTAVSAVCVTGLVVLDTARDFSPAGQAMILLLIQLGGLGIMTFSTAAFALLGRRLSLRHEGAVTGLVAHHRSEMFVAVRRMLAVTFGAELLGALALWPLFASAGDGVATALWRAVFTAVSAFCNAGFALRSDNLVAYARMPSVLHVVALLVIVGGLSPPVVAELPRWIRGRRLSVHSRMVLIVSAVLVLGGALLIGALEWSNTLRPLDRIDRLHGAWFQSVITRTAGFNSVDIAALRPATVWIMTALMFIGGSPGSTAGGIKTTTVAVLFIAAKSAMRGSAHADALGRRLRTATVYKAAALTTIAALAVFAGVVALSVTQPLSLDVVLFEIVSALGTVGLSMSATPLLDDVGKIVVMGAMFLGRVGPLTLLLFLRDRHADAPWGMPETELDVG